MSAWLRGVLSVSVLLAVGMETGMAEGMATEPPESAELTVAEWLDAEDPIQASLRVSNREQRAQTWRVEYSLQVDSAMRPPAPADAAPVAGAAVAPKPGETPRVGQVVAKGREVVRVPGGGSCSLALATRCRPGPGRYLLAVRLRCESREQVLQRPIMVEPKPLESVSSASRFGINASNGAWAPLLRRLSVGWVRFENLKWPFVSPAPGAYHFDGSVKPWEVNHDTILSGYTGLGLSVLPFLFMTADYASSAPPGVPEGRRFFYPPKDPQQFAEFAFQVAARYGARRHPASELLTRDRRSGLGYLHVYEIWNEPNLTDPGWGAWVGTHAQYLELLRAAAEAVKRADPAARVAHAGYAGIQVDTVDPLRSHTYADGRHPLEFVDILNVHFYSGRIPPEVATDDFNASRSGKTTAEEDFRRLVAWRDSHKPGMPIWLSETGYDSAGPYGTDERTQAARLPRVVMLALANGIDKVFVYRESGSTPSMHAASGVLRDDGSKKPSWLTYATLIRELDGVQGGAERVPYPDPNVRAYLWRRGREAILTAWTITGEGRLRVNLGRATVTDAFGHRRRADLRRGLGLSEFPVYVRGIHGSLRGLAGRGARGAARPSATPTGPNAKRRRVARESGQRPATCTSV